MTLELKSAIEGELAQGETDIYEIEMSAGEYAWVEVPACKLDVSLTLRSPGGELIETADLRKRSGALEELYWISDRAGTHRIEVTARGTGRYPIVLRELRAEHPGDRERIPAWRTYAEARELLVSRRELERAIELFSSTLPTWRQLGDVTFEASTLENVATCHRRLERVPAAISFYEQAIPVWQRAADCNAEANAWIGLGSAQQFLDQLPAARRSFERALEILSLEPTDNPKLRAVALNNLALVDKEQGALETARARLEKAEALRREVGDRAGLARTLVNRGSVLTLLGESAAAAAALEQGIAIAEPLGDQLRAPLALRRTMTLAHRQRRASEIERAWSDYQASSRRLSHRLLGPAAHLLRGKRLAIVADGALQTVCFGALAALDDDREWRPLLADHELVYLPSASALDLLRHQARDRAPAEKTLAVFADPVFSADDPRLRGTALGDPLAGEPEEVVAAQRSINGRLRFSMGEAEAAARAFSPAEIRVATGFEASIPTLRELGLNRYRIVHFATHAFVHERYPQLSGLILSRFDTEGRPIEIPSRATPSREMTSWAARF